MSVKEKTEKIINSLKAFIESKGKAFSLFLFLLILFVLIAFFSAIIQFCSSPSKKEKNQSNKITIDASFDDQKNLYIPEKNSMVQDYYFSRIPEEKWKDEEIKKWWTEIDKDFLENLGKSNDSLSEEITGGAP